MNANHILSRWERVAPMLHAKHLTLCGAGAVRPLTFWLALLYVARGQTSAPEMREHMRCSLSLAAAMLRLMEREGLARRSGAQQLHSRPRTLWMPTEKLFRMLALEPAATPHGKEQAS